MPPLCDMSRLNCSEKRSNRFWLTTLPDQTPSAREVHSVDITDFSFSSNSHLPRWKIFPATPLIANAHGSKISIYLEFFFQYAYKRHEKTTSRRFVRRISELHFR